MSKEVDMEHINMSSYMEYINMSEEEICAEIARLKKEHEKLKQRISVLLGFFIGEIKRKG